VVRAGPGRGSRKRGGALKPGPLAAAPLPAGTPRPGEGIGTSPLPRRPALLQIGRTGQASVAVALPPPLSVSRPAARRFMLRASLFDEPAPDVAGALDHLGYVQIDPLNVCGRMHDLILRNRVQGYCEGDLMRYVHPQPGRARTAFEHYLPGAGILVAFPLDAWPRLAPGMERRQSHRRGYAGRLSPSQERLARFILGELASRGPLLSDDIEHDAQAVTAWGGQGRAVKIILEKLFFHGRVLIAGRRGFRRVYDLPERILPASALARDPPPTREIEAWLVLARLRQRRLVLLKRAEFALVADIVRAVNVEGCPTLHCLESDAPELAAAEAGARKGAGNGGAAAAGSGSGDGTAVKAPPRLLAPLDPVVYDRRLTKLLWNFEYIWEAYTPASRRVRGYYALPVLSGLELVGHVDPRADRQAGRLEVLSSRIGRGHRVAGAVESLAGFLGLRAPR
jgi:uncharacterized protein YcaQ